MRRNLQVFYALFSALIFAAALPNEFLYFGSPLFGLAALIPLYMALANAASFKFAGLLTAIQITTVHLLSSFWLANFKGFAIFTLGGSAVAYFIWGYYMGQFIYGAFFTSRNAQDVLKRTGSSGGFDAFTRIFIFAATWTLWEYTKSTGFLAYPWGTILMSAFKMPIITQISDITGSFGISFLFAFFAAVIGEGLLLMGKKFSDKAYLNTYARTAAVCMILFCVSGIYGAYQYTKERTPIKMLETVLVQQNTDSWENGGDIETIGTSQRLTEEAIAIAGSTPDLVVWPESVLTYPFPASAVHYETNPPEKPFLPFIRYTGVPFIMGGPVALRQDGRMKYYNSALYFNKEGTLESTYAKMQLVPFAEIIPYSEYEWVRKIMKTLVDFSDGWTQGTAFTIFDVPLRSGGSVKVSAPICYEDAFPAVCRGLVKNGSEIFMNITNDSWSRTKSAEYQHYVMASYRAIEFRTTLVRATQSGYTAITDPTGRIIADLPLFEEASLYTSIPIYERVQTVFYRYGEWLTKLLLGCAVLLIVLQYRKIRNE